MTEYRRPALLEKKHDRTAFDSGVPSLDTWLRTSAGQSGRANTARTWVIADVDYRVVAYLAMSMTSVDISAAPEALRSGHLQQIPALLCGRLAVDYAYRGEGLGHALVTFLLAKAVELNESAACKAVVVDALDVEAMSFWGRYGFIPFVDDPDERRMFLPTKTIKTTLAEVY